MQLCMNGVSSSNYKIALFTVSTDYNNDCAHKIYIAAIDGGWSEYRCTQGTDSTCVVIVICMHGLFIE